MQINRIQNNYSKVQFRGFERSVVKPMGDLVHDVKHRNNTYIFRKDLDWNKLIEVLKTKYSKAKKVHVYNYACSTGLEAYSFIMKLMAKSSRDFADKFFPIEARDYDNFALIMAQTKMVDIWPEEKERIETHTYGGLDYFFTKVPKQKGKYRVNPVLTEKVNFDYGDITADYKTFNKDNTVLFARNFWPYLDREAQEKLPKLLYKTMGKNSLLIVGKYDCIDCQNLMPTNLQNGTLAMINDINYSEYFNPFLEAGFKPTGVPYIYSKD